MNENQEVEMKMLNENETQQINKVENEPNLNNEFKITVRKLEMPVRPRGVLAE
jgi:hypothetical protein